MAVLHDEGVGLLQGRSDKPRCRPFGSDTPMTRPKKMETLLRRAGKKES